MQTLGRRGLKKVAAVLALTLFLAGTNYCLLSAIPGSHGCGMAMASTPQASAAAQPRGHCPRCPSSAKPASAPKSTSASTDLPCCLVYGPAPAPTTMSDSDRLSPLLAMAVLVAPLALDIRTTAMARVQPRREVPPEERDATPRAIRAPPLL